jgi:alkylation response protein AidB-like acyl-CoA dehydrogenase
MQFAFDDEHLMLRDAIRAALERSAPIGRIREWAESGDPGPFDTIAAQQGWHGIGLSDDLGGEGGGLLERAILFEELGRAAAPSGTLLTAAAVLDLAVSSGSHIPEVLECREHLAFAAPADRPFDAIRADAFTVENTLISGATRLVLNATGSGQLVVPVRTGDKVAVWVVEADSPNVTVTPRTLLDRGRRFGDVRIDGATGEHVGTVPLDALRRVAARAAVLTAAESLGAARRMLEMTVGYAKERKQFGVLIGSFQAVKHAAAQMLVDIEAAHSGVYFAAWALDHEHPEAELHAWIVKAFAGEMGVRASDSALFLHGAIGYTWEYDLQLYFKRAKANHELFGSSKLYRERIAQALNLVPA